MHKSTTGYLSSAYIRSERRHAPTAASRPSGRFRYICKNSERSMTRLLRSHWRRSAFRPATAATSPFSRPIRSARDRSCSPCPPRRSRRHIRGFTTHSRPTGLPKERPCCASRWPGSRSWRRGRTATKSNRSKFSDRESDRRTASRRERT